MDISQIILSLMLSQDAKKQSLVHPAIAPAILKIETESQKPDFPLEELVPEKYNEGKEIRTRWAAIPSSYNYHCAAQITFEDIAVTYCLAKDNSGNMILAVRMKFPARLGNNNSINSIVEGSPIEVVSYNKGHFTKDEDLVDKRDNVKMTMNGSYGAPNLAFMAGFDNDGHPLQSWHIYSCDKFADKANRSHNDNPNWFQRKFIDLFWKRYSGFYRDIFLSDNGPNQRMATALTDIEQAARDRMKRRLEDDVKEGLYKVAITRQSEVCEPLSFR